MKIIKYFALTAMLLSANQASAFDDNREGFILGLGAGLHTIRNDHRLNDISDLTESSSGLASSFKIGGGISDRLVLYFVHNASRFRTPVTVGASTKEVTAVMFMDGIGASYFFEPRSPSGYIHAGLGGSVFAFPTESDATTRRGGAFMVGGGYEFDQHLMFEVTLLASTVSDPNNTPDKIQSSALQFTLNYMFY